MIFDWTQFAILLFIAVGLIMACAMLVMGYVFSPKATSAQMGMAYECGMVPFGDAWTRFHINYYVYALIFLSFEVDVIYLFPVALYYPHAIGFTAFLKVLVFLLVLGLAVVFFWAKGVFTWPKRIK